MDTPREDVTLDWSASVEMLPAAANQFLVQTVPGEESEGRRNPAEFILTVGVWVPRPFVHEGVRENEHVRVEPLARFAFSPQRARELQAILSKAIESTDPPPPAPSPELPIDE